MPKYLGDVRCWVNSGKHLLAVSNQVPNRRIVIHDKDMARAAAGGHDVVGLDLG